jgi:hypothetical protein
VGGAAAAAVVFILLNQLIHETWIPAAPVIAPAVAGPVMISPGRGTITRHRSGQAHWSWSATSPSSALSA